MTSPPQVEHARLLPQGRAQRRAEIDADMEHRLQLGLRQQGKAGLARGKGGVGRRAVASGSGVAVQPAAAIRLWPVNFM